jgi:hypothetical protein
MGMMISGHRGTLWFQLAFIRRNQLHKCGWLRCIVRHLRRGLLSLGARGSVSGVAVECEDGGTGGLRNGVLKGNFPGSI